MSAVTALIIVCLQGAPACDATVEVSHVSLRVTSSTVCLLEAETYMARTLPVGYQFVVHCPKNKA